MEDCGFETVMEYFPFSSEILPLFVPFSTTVAPIRTSPFVSVITPLIVWATADIARHAMLVSNTSFFNIRITRLDEYMKTYSNFN